MSPGEDGLIGIPFPEHSNELLSHLNDQRRAGLLCDLTLMSRGARYPTHRSVMAAVSLYFRSLFGAEENGDGGGGGGGGDFSVCQLDCVAPDALDALLEFAYTATLTIPSSGMRDVLRGAQLLGIQCVEDACRDILGETAEAEEEVAKEQRVHQAAAERMVQEESKVENVSRRKTDKKKVKRVGPHHVNSSSVLNPPSVSPVSHPSPASDSLRSLPSTQPPSPEQEDQNGDLGAMRDPGRTVPQLNGGFPYWLHERPRIALPPPGPDKLSDEDDLEVFAAEAMVMDGTSIPMTVGDRGAVVAAAAGVGRKRKSQTPQQCPVCQKIIHGAGKLPRHMRTHTGEKPFQCPDCGVRFTRNDKLKIHMRKHTGERPYPCPHCPARFLHSYDLKNHLSLHSGARPFECPLCHKAFAREDHLQRHRKGHSCLELRPRRARRGPEFAEDGLRDGGVREQSSPLEALSLQAHSSGFLPHMVLDGGSGSASGPPLMFPSNERERSLALQALAQLRSRGAPGYPQLFLRGLEMRGGRDGEDPGGTPSPARQRDLWTDEVEEENGEEEAEEEE